MPLTKAQERMLRQATTRHGRRKTGLFRCEGLRACREGLTRHPEWCELAVIGEASADSAAARALSKLLHDAGLEAAMIPDRDLARLAATESPSGIVCLFRKPPAEPPPAPPADPFVLLLDRVGEPGNLGTILRTAWAFGLTQVWITDGTADPFNPKVVRAGMGAQFALTIYTLADLAEARDTLAKFGIRRIWLSRADGRTDCRTPEFDLRNSALVIGNEAAGVADLADAASVAIPMPGNAESLNVAQAATILLFEAVRRGLLRS